MENATASSTSGEHSKPGEPALAGIRIVDASSGLAGPVATQLLAEMGAEVIKVEPPWGDRLRGTAAFSTWNRSKRGVVLDLATDAGRDGVATLLATADVLVHSFTPSRAVAFGLDDGTLLARYPRLVTCAVTGYPSRHPQAERPGYDILVQAAVGLMDEQAGHRDGPIFLRCPVPSWGAAYLAAAGVVARLVARWHTGRGGAAHTSLWQGALGGALSMHWSDAERPTPSLAAGIPKELPTSLFECADGVWVHVMPQPKKPEDIPIVAETMAALSEESLREARRSEPANLIFGDVGALRLALRRRPSREWLEAFWAAGVAALPALGLGEVLRDDDARRNGYVVTVKDPEWGTVQQAGPPVHLDPPPVVKGPAPRLGDATVADLIAALGDRREVEAETEGRDRDRRCPLQGFRVLDFGHAFAGPYAPMLLGDLGADVVKVETLSGDMMRFAERLFVGANRGKRSVAVDLKHPEARPVLDALLRWADVVHLNLRAAATRRLGIDEETLRRANPRLVRCHVTSYGREGKRAAWPGADQLFLAFCGWERACAGEGNPPMWLRVGFVDYQAALASLVGTLVGLFQRERTGQGHVVHTSLLGAGTFSATETLLQSDGSLAPCPLLDRDQTGVGPGYRIYRTVDDWVAVAADHDKLAAFRRVAGVHSDEELEAALGARAASDLLVSLDAAGVPAERVRTNQRLPFLHDPDKVDAGFVAISSHPDYGVLRQIGSLWDLGDLDVSLERAPPRLGQHTNEILAELGFSSEEIRHLGDIGAVLTDAADS